MSKKKIEFGEQVLAIMEADPEWSSDTLDAIGSVAIEMGLAELDGDTMFRRIAEPATPPATTPWPPNIMKAVRTEYFPASYTLVAKDGDGNRIKVRRHDSTSIERQHLEAARKLIRMKWTNSPEVLDENRNRLVGGWLAPAVYVWVVQEVQR